MTRGTLPDRYAQWIEPLAASSWRERKHAAEQLRRAVATDRDDPELLGSLAEVLLDGLVSPDALAGRASCHDVLVSIGAPAIQGLLGRLQRSSASLRLLVDLLGDIGDASHVGYLRAVAQDPDVDPNVRAAAAAAIGRLGGEDVHQSLLGLLGDRSAMLRVHVLDALRQAEVPVSVDSIEPALNDRFTRKAATALLAHSDDPDVVDRLVALTRDDNPSVRAMAVQSLGRVREALRERGHGHVVPRALAGLGPEAVAELRTLVSHHLPEVRVAAVTLLGDAGDVGLAPALLDVVDDPELLEPALAALERLGPAALDAALAAHVASGRATPLPLLRLSGAVAGPVSPEVLDFVCDALAESTPALAEAACEALSRVGDRRCVNRLLESLGWPSPTGEAAAQALAAVVRRDGGGELLERCVGPRWPQSSDLARNLCRVVAELGDPRFAGRMVVLLGSPEPGIREAAATALGRLRSDDGAAAALTFALTDENVRVRAAACRSLGQLGHPQSVHSLLASTHDVEAVVRAAAVRALVGLDNPLALGRFRDLIAEDPVVSVVVVAIDGLRASSDSEDLTILMALCGHSDREVAKAAARALVGFSEHRATAALLGLLGHERWDVRREAVEILARRGDRTAAAPLRRAASNESDPLVREAFVAAIERLGEGV